MMKVRKKLFTLSGLFMVLAQVFVAAFCGITAIAITKDETTKNLFDVNGSSATMAYELVDNDTIKWTVSLKKGAYDSPTRFMVDLVAGESSVVPEQIQSTNQEMVFESNYGDEYIQGGFSEQVTGSMSGEATISFVTTRQISNLVVTPKLVTVPATNEAVTMVAAVTADSTVDAEAEAQPTVVSEPVNLLENVPGVNFEIPAIVEEVVEESSTINSETVAIEGETLTSESEGAKEVVTETPEMKETTEEKNTITESSDTYDEIVDEVTSVEEPVERAQYQGLVSLMGPQLLATPVDPFDYTTDTAGTYPTHQSNSYSHSGAAIATSVNIRNYNYGATTGKNDNINLYNTSAGALNLRTGYHEYGSDTAGRLNTKKTVSPTADPNIFQVQLDTIGDAIRPFSNVDIVLVLDKSSSMNRDNPTRWKQLKSAVSTFATDILKENNANPGRIQIGMVGFSSNGTGNIRADVASFSDLTNTTLRNGFTTTATDITGHTLYTTNPTPLNQDNSSGTPTFIGIDAGLSLLHDTDAGARASAKKVMVTITDGIPTFYPSSNYSLSSATKTRENSNRILRYSTNRKEGTGSSSGQNAIDSKQPNIDFAEEHYELYPGSYFYSVGFHTGQEANEVVEALGPNGAFAASSIDTLVAALKNSVSNLIYTIANATIIDPMSQYVTLDAGSLTTATLSLSSTGVLTASPPSDSSEIVATAENNQVTVNNVNLGLDSSGRQGYRVTYKVTLNEEYRDGLFYPANTTTYLVNGDGSNKYYAVPSIRVAPTPVRVSFLKTNLNNEVLAGAKFELRNASNTYTSNVTGASGEVIFTNVLPGEYTLTEIQTPNGHISMTPIQVIVTRDGKIKGKDTGDELISVKNRLKQIDFSLNKVGPDNQPLRGATFVLKQGITERTLTESTITAGLHEITNLAPGQYKLIEKSSPTGYEILGELGTLTIDKYGTATFTKVEGSTQTATLTSNATADKIKLTLSSIKNKMKLFDFTVFKEDERGNALTGAEFTLSGPAGFTTQVLPVANGAALSTFTFTNLGPGTYKLVESKAPDGYVGLAGEITIVISNAGTITINGSSVTPTLNTGDAKNTFSYTVKNKQKVPLPATGGKGIVGFIMLGLLSVLVTGLYFFYRKDQEVA